MDDGWVEMGTLPAGAVFSTRDGTRWVKVNGDGDFTNCRRMTDPRQRDRFHNATPARPLTVTPTHPSLDRDAKAMLLGALESGRLEPLCDFLMERQADPDVRRAVERNSRERCAAFAESVARELDKPGGISQVNAACARTARELATHFRNFSDPPG